MKKVSVIIPAYNKADLTVKTVKSVLDQTYPNIEIIVVDDGSTDDTSKRLSSFSDKIRYVYKKNGGACSARNVGIKLAGGEYIGLLDCDDVYVSTKIARCVEYLEKRPDVGFVHTPVYLIDENDAILRIHPSHRTRRSGWIDKKLLSMHCVCNSTVIARKSCFQKVGYFDERIFIPADWDMWMRLAEQYKAGFINKPLTMCSTLSGYTLNHMEDSKREELVVLDKVFQRNPGFKPRFRDKLVSEVYRRHAVYYLSMRDFDRAKDDLVRSIQKYRFSLKALSLLIPLSILGKNFKLISACLATFSAAKAKVKMKFLDMIEAKSGRLK